MKRNRSETLAMLAIASILVLLNFGVASAQIQSAGGGYYVAGYGTVYGSFGQASVAQSQLYDKLKAQRANRQPAADTSRPAESKTVGPPPRVVRNQGLFRPDSTVDTGKAIADALADTPEENTLIRQMYAATKAAYEKEAAARGWKNNIAAGLTFFTVTAMTVYRDQEPSDDATNEYFNTINSALDEIPEFGKLSNKEKQGYNNMLVGFGGILLAGYTEAKQSNDIASLAANKKLAGMLIQMVLKTDPENLRVENGHIVMQ